MELENIVANTVYLKAREAADGKFLLPNQEISQFCLCFTRTVKVVFGPLPLPIPHDITLQFSLLFSLVSVYVSRLDP